MDVTKKRIQFKFINKLYLRRKSRHFSYLFLNHKLLAQYIARLEGNIWSHCTPKASPVSNNYHQAKYFIAELRDTNKKEFNKCHGHVFQLYISFKNDFHKVYVAERTSFRTLASWALFVYAWCCIIITVWNKKIIYHEQDLNSIQCHYYGYLYYFPLSFPPFLLLVHVEFQL